jgi:hypothetical protein
MATVRSVMVTLVMVLAASHVSAAMYTGTLSVSGGTLTAFSDWLTGPTTFTYKVDNETRPGFWHYEYTIAVTPGQGGGGAIQEILLGMDPIVTGSDLLNITLSFTGSLNTVALFANQGDKAKMPQPLYAADFVAGGTVRTVTVAFDTVYEPFWGSFFIRGAGQNALWNSSFTTTSVEPDTPASVFQPGWILRPGIPEPATLTLLGAGGVAMLCARRRRRQEM